MNADTPRPKIRELATPAEVAEWLRVAEDRLRKWRQQGKGPRFIKIEGRIVRYAWPDVHRWADENRSTNHQNGDRI